MAAFSGLQRIVPGYSGDHRGGFTPPSLYRTGPSRWLGIMWILHVLSRLGFRESSERPYHFPLLAVGSSAPHALRVCLAIGRTPHAREQEDGGHVAQEPETHGGIVLDLGPSPNRSEMGRQGQLRAAASRFARLSRPGRTMLALARDGRGE